MGILNAHHRVGALAKYAVTSSALSAAITVVSISIWHFQGVPAAIIGGSIATWISGRFFLNREVPATHPDISRAELRKAVNTLLRCGIPFTGSMLVGTGTHMLLPILVLHILNADSVGYYRAAIGISVGYLGFLSTAMGQDYYPRVSAAAGDTVALARIVNEQQRLVLLLSAPIILGTLALVPFAVPLLYSHRFTPTVNILEWQLIGDVFKFSAWTMSLMILAHCKTTTYFLIECISGVAIIASTFFGVRWFGLTGLGVSFVSTYVLYFVVVWFIARRSINLRWSSSNKRLMLAFVVAAFSLRAISFTPFAAFRTPFALTLACAAAIYSALTLWRDLAAMRLPTAPNVMSDQIETHVTIG